MNSGRENHIRFLQQSEIDSHKWDHCVSTSPNGLIYGYSFYLNQLAKNWSGLVLNDYEAVMPLPWNRKYGFQYLYQPPFTAQLGIFSSLQLEPALIDFFLCEAKKHFSFCEMHLNYGNLVPGIPNRTNYVLDLRLSYADVRQGFKKNLLQNLRKAETGPLLYEASSDYDQVIALFRERYNRRLPHISANDYSRFTHLCEELLQKDMLLVRTVYDTSGSRFLSGGIFFKDGRRIYNILPAVTPEGLQKGASPFLLDQMIREFCGQELLLDFEGSEIEGIAEFYRKFGSSTQPYPFLRFNHLPFPFRYFKKK